MKDWEGPDGQTLFCCLLIYLLILELIWRIEETISLFVVGKKINLFCSKSKSIWTGWCSYNLWTFPVITGKSIVHLWHGWPSVEERDGPGNRPETKVIRRIFWENSICPDSCNLWATYGWWLYLKHSRKINSSWRWHILPVHDVGDINSFE